MERGLHAGLIYMYGESFDVMWLRPHLMKQYITSHAITGTVNMNHAVMKGCDLTGIGRQ